MTFPELAATTSQPHSAPLIALADNLPRQQSAPQSWTVSVADAKYHWYDLIAGYPDTPDIRDPIGRYLRRMQFELDAAAEQQHLYCVVTRPRVRFDSKGTVQWGFFSLKLTLPLLMGADEVKETITIELKVPFAATIKKPTVSLTASFVTLNWGGLIETFSVHDVLRQHAHQLKMPSKVLRRPDPRQRRPAGQGTPAAAAKAAPAAQQPFRHADPGAEDGGGGGLQRRRSCRAAAQRPSGGRRRAATRPHGHRRGGADPLFRGRRAAPPQPRGTLRAPLAPAGSAAGQQPGAADHRRAAGADATLPLPVFRACRQRQPAPAQLRRGRWRHAGQRPAAAG